MSRNSSPVTYKRRQVSCSGSSASLVTGVSRPGAGNLGSLPSTLATAAGGPAGGLDHRSGVVRSESRLARQRLGLELLVLRFRDRAVRLEIGQPRDLLGGARGGDGLDVLAGGGVPPRGILRRMLTHLVAPGDEVHEDAEVRQEDHEDDPDGFGDAPQVAAAEDVGEDHDQQPDPDEEQEEPEHRPEDLTGAPLRGVDGHMDDPRGWLGGYKVLLRGYYPLLATISALDAAPVVPGPHPRPGTRRRRRRPPVLSPRRSGWRDGPTPQVIVFRRNLLLFPVHFLLL